MKGRKEEILFFLEVFLQLEGGKSLGRSKQVGVDDRLQQCEWSTMYKKLKSIDSSHWTGPTT